MMGVDFLECTVVNLSSAGERREEFYEVVWESEFFFLHEVTLYARGVIWGLRQTFFVLFDSEW